MAVTAELPPLFAECIAAIARTLTSDMTAAARGSDGASAAAVVVVEAVVAVPQKSGGARPVRVALDDPNRGSRLDAISHHPLTWMGAGKRMSSSWPE